jgi:ubiquinone/menaquinone biosynthesis C-methylase UbiE
MEISRDIKTLFESEYRDDMIYWFGAAYGNRLDTTQALSYLLKENHSDEMIYALTHAYTVKYTTLHKKEDVNKAKNRLEKRTAVIRSLLEGIEYPKNIYLDVGCETMVEADALGKILEVSEIRCINIDDWVGFYEENEHAITEDSRFSYYDGVNIPHNDDSISVVSMSMVIHHVEKDKKLELLKNVHRVLEPGGILIIREHSSYDAQESPEEKKLFDTFVDFIHHYFDSVINKNYRWVDDYETTYTSAEGLKTILEQIGFKSVKRIDIRGSDRKYHEVFEVIKDKD